MLRCVLNGDGLEVWVNPEHVTSVTQNDYGTTLGLVDGKYINFPQNTTPSDVIKALRDGPPL